MLFDPRRHEPLAGIDWDPAVAAHAIERIALDTEQRFSPDTFWPVHPLDAEGADTGPFFNLYFGAGGVVWALHALQSRRVTGLRRSYGEHLDACMALNRRWLASQGFADIDRASYLMGDTSLLMLRAWLSAGDPRPAQIEDLVVRNLDNPARELMWGSPGTMLAAMFMHEQTGDSRWRDLYATTSRKLWSQLVHSDETRCNYWTQDLYGRRYRSSTACTDLSQRARRSPAAAA